MRAQWAASPLAAKLQLALTEDIEYTLYQQ